MSKVTINKINFCGWSDCLEVTSGEVRVIVSTSFGTRVLSVTTGGGQNHMALFPDTLGKIAPIDTWSPYGGHRLWHAPEVNPRTYLPDNDKVSYELLERGVRLTQNTEKGTGLRKSITLTIDDSGVITVAHTIANESMFDVELSIWCLSQLSNGGLLAIPNNDNDTGYVSNRVVSMWTYSKMNDKRVYWGDKYITVKPDETMTNPFKLGASVGKGYAGYFNFNQLFVKNFDSSEGAYPNYSCNFETYTNHEFIEFESLSTLAAIKAGSSRTHVEKWKIIDNIACPDACDEDKIAQILEKYSKL